jgi:hypothetical protein
VSAEGRNHLARLCRGFLLAREEDPRRAEAFLVSFLTELDRGHAGAAAVSSSVELRRP